jgi:CheY-like chemotaxis protein
MAAKLRVLIVDDDPAAARLYKTYLVADGHDVVVANSGIEGVEATERNTFDVVVMDLNMPGLGRVDVDVAHQGAPPQAPGGRAHGRSRQRPGRREPIGPAPPAS